MKQAAAGEFRLSGTRRGAVPWQVRVGDNVPPAAAQFLTDLFTRPAYGILDSIPYGDRREPPVALVDELAARGYDLATLRISLFQKGFGTPRRPRVYPVIAGSLVLRWGWVDYDHSPEVGGTWAAPATNRDLNLLFSMLSSPTTPEREVGQVYVRLPSNLRRVEELGWDLRTLDFRVRCTKPLATHL